MLIGVNGVGKTTSVGKLAGLLKAQNKKVIMAAADTFRAAAIEQLTEWSNRTGADIIAQSEGSDPAAVIYDSIAACKDAPEEIPTKIPSFFAKSFAVAKASSFVALKISS